MDTIKRTYSLYETDVEYGDYCINHVRGCAHGCSYCYAFIRAHQYGRVKDIDEWRKPVLVENTLDLLDKQIPSLKADIAFAHLSFTTDPFMQGYPEVQNMSMKVLEKLNKNGITCSVLSKGLLPFELADGNRFDSRNVYGITLVSLSETFREKWEPGAAPIAERLNALKCLHDKGCKTWVSIEPYPTPNIISQDIKEILSAVSFVDKIIFGRWNYSKEISNYGPHREFYNRCAQEVIEFCQQKGMQCHIKEGTLSNRSWNDKNDKEKEK